MPRLAGMAYDTELADRIRFLIGTGPGVTEKKMAQTHANQPVRCCDDTGLPEQGLRAEAALCRGTRRLRLLSV